MNDVITEAYNELLHLGMVNSNVQFSTDYLGKSRHYFAMLKSSGRDCSLDAEYRLAATLKNQYELLTGSRWGEHRLRGEQLYPLVRKVWTASYEKALER